MTVLHVEAMVGAGLKPAPNWDSLIDRCKVLAQRYPSAREILSFYQKILIFQKRLYEEIKRNKETFTINRESCRDRPKGLSAEDRFKNLSLHLKKGMEKLLPLSPLLLSVAREGSPLLATMAKEVSSWGVMGWEATLADFQLAIHRDQPLFFFPRVLLQPYLQCTLEIEKDTGLLLNTLAQEECTEEVRPQAPNLETFGGRGTVTCPFCGHRPQVGYLRPLDNASQRLLVCSFCRGEWPHKRLSCPGCAESDKTKLSYFVAEEYPAIRVDVCDTCGQYIKTVDMGRDPEAVPVVDELASIPLNLWARESGYEKLEVNLLGI